MDTPESKVHSFIVKLSLEETDEGPSAVWRGYITHVPSGARRYLKDIDDIVTFVRLYVGNLGSESPASRTRLRSWLRRSR